MNEKELITFVEEVLGEDLKAFYEGRATAARGYKLVPGQIWAEPTTGYSHFSTAAAPSIDPWAAEGQHQVSSVKDLKRLMKKRAKPRHARPASAKAGRVGIGVQLTDPMIVNKDAPLLSKELARFIAAHEAGHAVDHLHGKSKKDLSRVVGKLRSMVKTEAKRNPEAFTKAEHFQKGQRTFKWMDRGRHEGTALEGSTPAQWNEYKAGGKYFDKKGNVRPEMLEEIAAKEVKTRRTLERRQEKFADKFAVKKFREKGLKPPNPVELDVSPNKWPETSAHGGRHAMLKRGKMVPLLLLASLLGVGAGAGAGSGA